MKTPATHYIDGAFVESHGREVMEIVKPTDSQIIGRVTLGEAYRYAYNQTLVATAATAVGSQHATLETGLRGKGEVVLSYPAASSAQLELPAPLDGEVLVRNEPSGSVLAELHKVAGRPLKTCPLKR